MWSMWSNVTIWAKLTLLNLLRQLSAMCLSLPQNWQIAAICGPKVSLTFSRSSALKILDTHVPLFTPLCWDESSNLPPPLLNALLASTNLSALIAFWTICSMSSAFSSLCSILGFKPRLKHFSEFISIDALNGAPKFSILTLCVSIIRLPRSRILFANEITVSLSVYFSYNSIGNGWFYE